MKKNFMLGSQPETDMAAEPETIIALTRSAGFDDATYTDYVAIPEPLYLLLAAFVEKGTLIPCDDRFRPIAEVLEFWEHKDMTRQDLVNVAFTIAQQNGRQVTFPNWTYTVDD